MARVFLEQRFRELESKPKSWASQYQKLRAEADKQEEQLKLTTNAAKSSKNIMKNRYRDVFSYDHSRVRLMGREDDYINASLVPVEGAGRKYILTQGPLGHTAADFWQMVWEQDSRAVVMLNRVVEKNQPKCHAYFPTAGADGALAFGAFGVALQNERVTDHFVVRQLLLSRDDDDHSEIDAAEAPRLVVHFQFITWPDFGVPRSTDDFLEFLLEVRNSGMLDCTNFGPPIVHCSAGIGRTGTFVIVDAVLLMAHANSANFKTDIFELVLKLRTFRMGLIQTCDQLRFCWKAVVDALTDDRWLALLDVGVRSATGSDASPSPKRHLAPSVERTSGNQLSSGDSFVSVDNSDLVARKRSRPAPSADEPSVTATHSASDVTALLHDCPDDVDADVLESAASARRAAAAAAAAERNRRVLEIKRKMRQSESRQGWPHVDSWVLLGAASVVAAVVVVFTYFWKG